MASDPLVAVQQLQSVVTTLAPSLRPQVLPKGVEYGLDLILSLCKTEEQRQTLLTLVRSSKPNGDNTSKTQNDEDTDEEESEDYLEPQVVGTFDVENRVFAVEKVQWMHEREAVIHEFARFIELQLENPIAAQQVVQHFLEINGHKKEESTVAQQCFSAAFALQTLLRAFPRLPVAIDGMVIEINEDTDIAEVFAPLFASKTKKNNKTKAKSAQKQEAAKKVKAKEQKT
ncbi:Hypothetical protein PHPALM_8005, partial [Phytophthora palmivora]